MIVEAVIKLSEAEVRKRVDEDAKSLMDDARLMHDLENNIGKHSFVQKGAFAALKKAIQVNLLAAKVAGNTIDWKQIMTTMKIFSESAPFKVVSYGAGGKVVMEYDDSYVIYIGYAKMKLDAAGAEKEIMKTLAKVLETNIVNVRKIEGEKK